METISPIIEYQDQIQNLNIDRIEPNIYNPRERFNEEEEDELIDSILTKGILNPIIVYKGQNINRYVILDGERRFRACKKLNIKKIPARILVREPNVLESLSLMFHIHNVREEWTEFAISLTIKRIIDEMGKDFSSINNYDIKDLSRITSLSEYKVRKYLKFLDYPDEVIQMFLHSEVTKRGNEGPDPDILLEMHKPIQDIKECVPSLLNHFSIKDMIDACIRKKEEGFIKTNKEFRLVAQSLTAAKKGEINLNKLSKNLEQFFSTLEYTPERLYHLTAEDLYQYKNLIKHSEGFLKQLEEFNFESLDKRKQNEIVDVLNRIIHQIRTTI